MGFKRSPLRPKEEELFQKINDGNIEAVQALLKDRQVRVDCYDKTGMTPLQQAAFKGNREMCELLLARGSNVNTTEHDHRYSTLTFAALSGNLETVKCILAAGADTESMNTLNRTASQMAAFVGFHEIVNTINSYFSKAEIEYFTEPHGVDGVVKLSKNLIMPLYGMISHTNIHPVKHLLYIKEYPELLAPDQSVIRVLEDLCTKQVKQKETNEVLSMKLHYLGYLLKTTHKAVYGTHAKISPENDALLSIIEKKGKIDGLIKNMLRGDSMLDGFPVFMEKFLRQMIREYPYHSSALLQQMVHGLSRTEIGGSPSALTVLMQCLFGQHAMQSDDSKCDTCGTLNAEKRCSACKMVNYCALECQKLHWFTHKTLCKQLAEKAERLKRESEMGNKADVSDMGDIPPDCMAAMDMAHMNNIKCAMEPEAGEVPRPVVTQQGQEDGSELQSAVDNGVSKCPHSGQTAEPPPPHTNENNSDQTSGEGKKCPFSGQIVPSSTGTSTSMSSQGQAGQMKCPFSGMEAKVDGSKLSELLAAKVGSNTGKSRNTTSGSTTADTSDVHIDLVSDKK